MKRSIRKSKRTCTALDSAIQSTDDELLKRKLQNKFERHSAILKEKEKRLNNFCNKFGMQKQNDRVRIVGFNKSVSQKAVQANKSYLDKKTKRGIMKSKPYEIKRTREERKAIIKRGIAEKEPVFSVDTEINKFPSNARNISRDKDYYYVIAHGRDTSVDFFGENIDDYTMASIIRNRKDYVKGKKIKLISCRTGNTDNIGDCFAQLLANELGVVVEAPNKTIFVNEDGSYFIGRSNEGKMVKLYPRK